MASPQGLLIKRVDHITRIIVHTLLPPIRPPRIKIASRSLTNPKHTNYNTTLNQVPLSFVHTRPTALNTERVNEPYCNDALLLRLLTRQTQVMQRYTQRAE